MHKKLDRRVKICKTERHAVGRERDGRQNQRDRRKIKE